MTKYISVPQKIDAVQWAGDIDALIKFAAELEQPAEEIPAHLGATAAWSQPGMRLTRSVTGDDVLHLETIDDEWVPCPRGHYVIVEPVPNRYYPCSPEVMATKYRAVD